MKENKDLNTNFQSNLDYVLINLEKDIFKVNSLEDKLYFEISKDDKPIIKAPTPNSSKYDTKIDVYT